MAVTHKLKTDAGAGLRTQRERPAAAHSGNNKMALMRRLADNRNELIPIAITHQKRNFFVNGLVSGIGRTGSVYVAPWLFAGPPGAFVATESWSCSRAATAANVDAC